MFAGKNEVWISADRRTKLVYDPATARLNIHVADVLVGAFDDTGLLSAIGFTNTGLKIQDPTGDHEVSIVPGEESADRTLTIPVLGANDTVATLGVDQTFAGQETFTKFPIINAGPSSQFMFIEDFHGTWAIGDAGPADNFSTTAGAGTGNAAAVTVAGSINGEVTIKSASDDGTNAQNSSVLTAINLCCKANRGGLFMEARLQVDAITDVAIFCGFTDTISTTVELPIFLNAADIDSDATDACGIIFDTDATIDQWCHGGVKAGADTVPAFSGSAPAAATYVVLRVEVSAVGAVRGYINGVAIGAAVAAAVTETVALTPCIVISNRGAAQRVLTLDYIMWGQNR